MKTSEWFPRKVTLRGGWGKQKTLTPSVINHVYFGGLSKSKTASEALYCQRDPWLNSIVSQFYFFFLTWFSAFNQKATLDHSPFLYFLYSGGRGAMGRAVMTFSYPVTFMSFRIVAVLLNPNTPVQTKSMLAQSMQPLQRNIRLTMSTRASVIRANTYTTIRCSVRVTDMDPNSAIPVSDGIWYEVDQTLPETRAGQKIERERTKKEMGLQSIPDNAAVFLLSKNTMVQDIITDHFL